MTTSAKSDQPTGDQIGEVAALRRAERVRAAEILRNWNKPDRPWVKWEDEPCVLVGKLDR